MHNDKKQIYDTIDTLNPNNIENLVHSATLQTDMKKNKVKKIIFQMIDDNEVTINNPKKYKSINNFLIDIESSWFWVIIISIVSHNIITIVSISYNEILFLRYIISGVFTYFTPGYALVKTIFLPPNNNQVEQVALSIALSLVVTPVTSLVLNYTPGGITLTSISIGISALSLFFAFLGLIRRYYNGL